MYLANKFLFFYIPIYSLLSISGNSDEPQEGQNLASLLISAPQPWHLALNSKVGFFILNNQTISEIS